MLDRLLGGVAASFAGGSPLGILGGGGIGGTAGVEALAAVPRGGATTQRTIESAPDHTPSASEAAHTELMDEPGGCQGYAPKAGEGAHASAPQAQGGGPLGFLSRLADPLGLFAGINMADPLGLLGGLLGGGGGGGLLGGLLGGGGGSLGGGGLSGLLGAEGGQKAAGMLGDQAQMGGLISMLGSGGGGATSLLKGLL